MSFKKIQFILEQVAKLQQEPPPEGENIQDPSSLPPAEDAPTEEDVIANTQQQTADDSNATQEPNVAAGADVNMADPSMDPSMSGMGGEEPGLTKIDLGFAYELKNIYNRLTSLESYLGTISDAELIELRDVVLEAMDLFNIVISNYQAYKENIKDIIILFYKFIDGCYETASNYLKNKMREEERENKKLKNKKSEGD